jgi:hypothetical protein
MPNRERPRPRTLAVALCVALGACLKAPAPPAPAQLTTSRSPADVVQIASRELTAAGFEIASSDAATGTVVAQRVRTPNAHQADVKCSYQRGSIADERAQASFVVKVNARQAGTSGSEVQITSSVQSDRSTLPAPFKTGPNDKDCVSSGVIEKRVADALQQ